MHRRRDAGSRWMLAIRVALPAALGIALYTLVTFVVILPAFERGLLAHKKEGVRDLASTAWTILNRYEHDVQTGDLTRPEAQALAARHIRDLRYGPDLAGYFWVHDLNRRMIVHPIRPELEGKDLSSWFDSTGKRLFVEFADTAGRGGGFVDYAWRHREDAVREVPKTAYVQLFEPWGWVLGTGLYVDDVAAQIAAMSRSLTLAALGTLVIVVALVTWVVWQAFRAEAQRRRAETEWRRLREQLHQAQRMEAVGQLAAGVAHDFNNLLTVIQASVDQLREMPPGSPGGTGLLDTIECAVGQAVGVTRSLLSFSQKLCTRRETVDLRDVVQQATRLLRHALRSSIELDVDMAAAGPLWVYADHTQLQQVLLNLAVNAADAMPAGGTLRIAVSPGGDAEQGAVPSSDETVRLVVEDTGTGIPSEQLESIFEPFFTTKPRGQGTGLGLAIVRGIVEDHDGRITVTSQVGAGTRFTITWPCIAAQVLPTAVAAKSVAPRGGGELVLIAEDHRHAREFMAGQLVGLGYRVIEAGDAPALLDCYRRNRQTIRLIVADLDLPGGSGWDCLREVRAGGNTVPAVLITGCPAVDLDRRIDEHTALLRKPFRMVELGRIVSVALRGGPLGEVAA